LLRFPRIEDTYELAYLKIFVQWEIYLEDCFLRYLCGYSATNGMAPLRPGGTYYPSLAAATAAMLGSQAYALWHNPTKIIQRCSRFFNNGPIESTINSHSARLAALASVRHRIAHGQDDARLQFDAATMAIVGRRYRGARAGSFLRDLDTSQKSPVRWLESLSSELRRLALQIT
jgi:hypothetical protein